MVRFWIITMMLVLFGLSTLKLSEMSAKGKAAHEGDGETMLRSGANVGLNQSPQALFGYYHDAGAVRSVDTEAQMNLSGKNALVLGLGETGLSMARFLARRARACASRIRRAKPPAWRRWRKTCRRRNSSSAAFTTIPSPASILIAISPGRAARDPAVRAAAARGVPVVGDIELFAQALRARSGAAPSNPADSPPQVLAITGTNGKTTVTRSPAQCARRAGLAAEVAGNIGPAALDALTAIAKTCSQSRRCGCWNFPVSSSKPRAP